MVLRCSTANSLDAHKSPQLPPGHYLIPLKSVIEQYRKEPGAPVNRYEWYRRTAHSKGAVHIGEVEVPVQKVAGAWQVDEKDFKRAIHAHRAHRAAVAKATRELRRGIIHLQNGAIVETEGGSYQVHGPFRLEISDYETWRRRSNGTWICNDCNQVADINFEKEECHLCADWGGCGRDRTLSEVRCRQCGHVLRF